MPASQIGSDRSRLQNISMRYWANRATKDEKDERDDAFNHLAATYNEVMRAEREHRTIYGCKPNWTCRCPVHTKLSRACHSMYDLISCIDYMAADGTTPLTATWWQNRGYNVVIPGDDPVFDYVLRDGQIPVAKDILQRAASWWVKYVEANLPGRARPPQRPFDLYDSIVYDPIDWTDERRQQLQTSLVKLFAEKFVTRKAPEGLEPLRLNCGRWGHDYIFADAFAEAQLGCPTFQEDIFMIITPASITVSQTVGNS
jgi:hypothetical protein